MLTKKLFEQIRLLLYVINKYGFWLNHMDFPPWRTEADTETAPGKKRRDSQSLLIAGITVWFPNGSYFRAFPLNIQRIFKKPETTWSVWLVAHLRWPRNLFYKRSQMRRPLSFVKFWISYITSPSLPFIFYNLWVIELKQLTSCLI